MFLAVFIITLIIIIVLIDCDLVLKCYELFGSKPETKLRGKVVWITGASSGIGEALSYELAKCGCKLVLSARRQEELDRVKENCAAFAQACYPMTFNKDQDILVLPLDILQYESHQELTKTVLGHFNKIDILVNNGGRTQRSLILETTGISVNQAMFNLNVLGTISLTKAVLPHMVERKEGHIVVTSSIAGKIGSPSSASYSSTKHAVQGYFNTLRIELFDDNVDVTMVCPGPVQTNAVRNSFTEDVSKSFSDKVQVKENKKRMTVERCARLMVIGMANKLSEVWITPNPVLLFIYVAQYCPVVYNWISKRVGMKQVRRMRGAETEHEEDFKPRYKTTWSDRNT